MQNFRDLDIVLYSQRDDIKIFCQKLFEDFSNFSLEADVRNIQLSPNCISIIDGHVLTEENMSYFLIYQRNILKKTVCLLPFDISPDIKKFIAANFINIIPIPISKDLFMLDFMDCEKNIKLELSKSEEDTDELNPEEEKLFSSFQGNSRLIRYTRSEIIRLAHLDSPVLITGETGTGKTTAAKLIHKLSSRRHNPFIERSISNTEEPLADSHFFGTEPWSFTGAKSTKGWFQLADTGTLFLDEIGTASPGIQSKLLTVLDDGKVTKVGGEKSLKVDVRMIFATNANLDEMKDNKTFREDLLYRIKRNKLVIPALRERPEDIGVIAEIFANRNGKHLLPDAILKLEQLPWYGNVRELDTVIQNTCEKVHEKDISAAQLRFI